MVFLNYLQDGIGMIKIVNKKEIWGRFHQYDNVYGIHRKLRCYIEDNGTQYLNYFISHLSHEIYKRHGITGHIARKKIRVSLKNLTIKMERQIALNKK